MASYLEMELQRFIPEIILVYSGAAKAYVRVKPFELHRAPRPATYRIRKVFASSPRGMPLNTKKEALLPWRTRYIVSVNARFASRALYRVNKNSLEVSVLHELPTGEDRIGVSPPARKRLTLFIDHICLLGDIYQAPDAGQLPRHIVSIRGMLFSFQVNQQT